MVPFYFSSLNVRSPKNVSIPPTYQAGPFGLKIELEVPRGVSFYATMGFFEFPPLAGDTGVLWLRDHPASR